LCAPFAYLQDITDQVRGGAKAISRGRKAKTARNSSGLGSEACSDSFLSCGENESQSEQFSPVKPSEYLRNIAFPQCVKFTRFSNINFQLAAR